MTLEHLWAGWRAEYVASASGVADPPVSAGRAEAEDAIAGSPVQTAQTAGCVFCAIFASGLSDAETYVAWWGDEVVALMNAYPYASGHLMVMPRRHVRELDELQPGEEGELWAAVRRAVAAVKLAYRPDGCNLGVNLGRAAGAGIPGHLHVHVVPRWVGDTNFMTAAACTRVLPEPLEESWRKVRSAWV